MRALWVSLAVLLVDQFTKVLVKTRMTPGEPGAIPLIGDWLRFTFTENPGMAFGITFGMPMVVTGFAIIATVAIMVYLWYVRESPFGYRLSLAFILGGALGNIIDRVFYGAIFSYGGLFQGRVVDFIHLNVYNGPAADWIPYFGGKWVSLFPIWNVADMSIVCGVTAILLFQRRLYPDPPLPGSEEASGLQPTAQTDAERSGQEDAPTVAAIDGELSSAQQAPGLMGAVAVDQISSNNSPSVDAVDRSTEETSDVDTRDEPWNK